MIESTRTLDERSSAWCAESMTARRKTYVPS
jgi:hypothetical protein